VERSAQARGKLVWYPTLEARSFRKFHKHEDWPLFLTVVDENGKLLPQAVAVLETAAQYKMTVGTGHLSAQEGMLLVTEAARLDCRLVLTHADNPANRYTLEQQVEAVRLGAFVEHSFFTTYYDRIPIEEIAVQIRAVGCEHVILTTDFGQPNSPYADEGMAQYAAFLLEQGFSETELRSMMCDNPKLLVS